MSRDTARRVLSTGRLKKYDLTRFARKDTARSNRHLISAAEVDNELRIYIYSLSLGTLKGNEGVLCSFKLKLKREPAVYAITPSVVLGDAAAIRVLVFKDRVEIINPGCLYGGLQVEDIKLGVSRQRNPLIASLASKTMIYRGLGSGIIRVLNENISVDFINEESANQFKTIIWRTIQKDENTIQKNENTIQKNENTIQKSLTTIQKEVLEFLKNNPNSTLVEVIDSVPNLSEGGLKFIIMKLKKLGLLKREGGRKSGIWVVVDNK